jgi:hypothetical protein
LLLYKDTREPEKEGATTSSQEVKQVQPKGRVRVPEPSIKIWTPFDGPRPNKEKEKEKEKEGEKEKDGEKEKEEGKEQKVEKTENPAQQP